MDLNQLSGLQKQALYKEKWYYRTQKITIPRPTGF